MKTVLKTGFMLLLAYTGIQLFAQNNNDVISASIRLLKTSADSTNSKTLVTLSFKNKSNQDVFIGDMFSYLASDNGSFFVIYKNNKYFPNYLDTYGSITKPPFNPNTDGDVPAPNVVRILKNKHIIDSLCGKACVNKPIARAYFKTEKSRNDNKLCSFIQGNCLFLKAHELRKYFFVLDISGLIEDTGLYMIKYEPVLKEKNPQYPALDKVLSYKRIYPKTIKCNKLSVAMVN